MKYISLAIILVLLAWTWSMATTERSFRLEQHKRVEAGVEDDIRAFIKRKYPNTAEVYCPQLYTQSVSPGTELLVKFRCQAMGAEESEPTTEQIFEGHLRLKSTDGFDTWSETGGEIRSPEIRFLKPLVIKPGGGSDELPVMDVVPQQDLPQQEDLPQQDEDEK